jgi:hypothetical protein
MLLLLLSTRLWNTTGRVLRQGNVKGSVFADAAGQTQQLIISAKHDLSMKSSAPYFGLRLPALGPVTCHALGNGFPSGSGHAVRAVRGALQGLA